MTCSLPRSESRSYCLPCDPMNLIAHAPFMRSLPEDKGIHSVIVPLDSNICGWMFVAVEDHEPVQ